MITFAYMISAAAIGISAPIKIENTVQTTPVSDPYKASEQCVADKTKLYHKRATLAADLARQISLECAELLPQRNPKDCGANQYLCDEIQDRTNADITALNEELAYKLLVTSRQGNK